MSVGRDHIAPTIECALSAADDHHDCRGQDIAGAQSHKSYRPVTVLSFRLLAHIARHFTAVPQPQPGPDPAAPRDKPPPFGTAPFHLANIALHCLVTCALYRWGETL